MEPIAAAYAYESTLTQDELILIGDFGGGTSDFSLIRVGPTSRTLTRQQRILGNSGLGLAGDAFDARIVRKLVSPALGSESFERSYAQASDRPANIIPAAPAWIYRNLERWHYLSFLKTRNVAEILKAARARAEHPDQIAALITLIEEDLGYQLHQAVQRLKVVLSHEESAQFKFRDGSMEIERTVSRADFESWIAEELASIETCVDSPTIHDWHKPQTRSTVSSSPEAPASSQPSAASSSPASRPPASAPATSSPPWPRASPCAPSNLQCKPDAIKSPLSLLSSCQPDSTPSI